MALYTRYVAPLARPTATSKTMSVRFRRFILPPSSYVNACGRLLFAHLADGPEAGRPQRAPEQLDDRSDEHMLVVVGDIRNAIDDGNGRRCRRYGLAAILDGHADPAGRQ